MTSYFINRLQTAAVVCFLTCSVPAFGADAPRDIINKLHYFRPAAAAPQKDTLPTAKASPAPMAVVNSASYLPGVSPGGFGTIFGGNLTDISGTVIANTNPLPTQLANVSVLVNGVYAPLFSIAYADGEDQISFQVPYDTATGAGSVYIEVRDYGQITGSAQIDSYIEDPGIFMYQGTYAVALIYPSYTLVGANNPARPGDTIILYGTGLGPLSQYLTDGYGAPSNPPASTLDPFDVIVNGEKCRVLFSGLAPGFVGLYQLNLVLPSDLPNGNLNIHITSPYAGSNDATLPVLY